MTIKFNKKIRKFDYVNIRLSDDGKVIPNAYTMADLTCSSKPIYQRLARVLLQQDPVFTIDIFVSIWNRQMQDEKQSGTKYRNFIGLNAKDGIELLPLGKKLEAGIRFSREDIGILKLRMVKYIEQSFSIMIEERIARNS